MNITDPSVKGFIHYLLAFESGLADKQGQPVRRTTFAKRHAIGAASLIEAIESQMVVVQDGAIVERDKADPSKPAHMGHVGTDLAVSDGQLAALKHYYKEADELPAASSAVLHWAEENLQ